MSRKLKIVNGPAFRGFVVNAVLTETSWDAIFTMNQSIPSDHISIRDRTTEFQIRTEMLGRGRNADEYRFIARVTGRSKIWFYVGFYDPCVRIGECVEMTSEEFVRSSPILYLFPELVR